MTGKANAITNLKELNPVRKSKSQYPQIIIYKYDQLIFFNNKHITISVVILPNSTKNAYIF